MVTGGFPFGAGGAGVDIGVDILTQTVPEKPPAYPGKVPKWGWRLKPLLLLKMRGGGPLPELLVANDAQFVLVALQETHDLNRIE